MPTSRDVGDHYAILRRMTPEPRSAGRDRRRRSERAGALLVGVALVVGFLLVRGLPADAEVDTLIPCVVGVEPGDTMYAIAERRLGDGARWGEIAALNPEVADPHVIHVGQLLRWCAETTPLAEVAVLAAAEPRPLTDAERWAEPGVRLSPAGAAECFWGAGFRDRETLVVMVATAIGESALRVGAVGDTTIAGQRAPSGETWAASYGIAQIRGLEERRGTGDARDPDALLADYRHACAASWEISQQGTNFVPWTAYRWWQDHETEARAGVAAYLG